MKIYPSIEGECPACGKELLFVADGGHITCSVADCPNPDAASLALKAGPKNQPHLQYEDGYEKASSDLREDYETLKKDYAALEEKTETIYQNYQDLQGKYLKAIGDLDEQKTHLQYETSERGFMSLPAIPSSYGGTVRVYESSTAEQQYVWLSAVAPKNLNNPTGDTVTAPIHLTVENAKALAEQLLFLVDEHYQGSDDDEYDDDVDWDSLCCNDCGRDGDDE